MNRITSTRRELLEQIKAGCHELLSHLSSDPRRLAELKKGAKERRHLDRIAGFLLKVDGK